MGKESAAMKEIHEIRVRYHEETKNIERTDFLKYVHEEAALAREELGLNENIKQKDSA